MLRDRTGACAVTSNRMHERASALPAGPPVRRRGQNVLEVIPPLGRKGREGFGCTREFWLPCERCKSLPGHCEFLQQGRRAVTVVAGLAGKGGEPVANITKPHAVGVMHRSAAVDRKAVAVDPDHVDIAGPLRDPLSQYARALIDHREQQTFDDLVLAEDAACDAALRRR